MPTPDFSQLPIGELVAELEHKPLFIQLNHAVANSSDLESEDSSWAQLKQQWQYLHHSNATGQLSSEQLEAQEVDWLITVFNKTFAHHNVILARGEHEPEYFPAHEQQPARIEFAHGFFQSALHEISHWSIAGSHRRTLPDFGYWYAPDGRTEAQQSAFERVEIKPQAIECLFTLMCHKRFRVSQDNLNADFDTSHSTFANDVFNQATDYIQDPNALPKDAQTLLTILTALCHDNMNT